MKTFPLEGSKRLLRRLAAGINGDETSLKVAHINNLYRFMSPFLTNTFHINLLRFLGEKRFLGATTNLSF